MIQLLFCSHLFHDSAAEDVIIRPPFASAGAAIRFAAADDGFAGQKSRRMFFSAAMATAHFEEAAIRILHTLYRLAFAFQIAEWFFGAAFGIIDTFKTMIPVVRHFTNPFWRSSAL